MDYSNNRRAALCAAILMLLPALCVLAADEWPQFRGPDGQGHAGEAKIPIHWSEQQNVKWKTAIPGEGWSSPAISGNQIWMTTASEDGKLMRAVCVDRESGALRFDVPIFTNELVAHKNLLNSYASPSPILENGRVYVHFGTYGTAALSTSDGRILWTNRDLRLDHEEGPGSSPALYQDKLIIPCDGTNLQYVTALDKNSGKVAWMINRSGTPHPSAAHRKAFFTPLIISVNGQDQAIIQGANTVWSYDPKTGKEIWKVRYEGFSGAPRPVFADGLLYICTGFFKSRIWAIRPTGLGDVTDTNVVWRSERQAPQKPSIIFEGGNIFYANDGGVASCLKADTGAELWHERIEGEYSASPISANHHIYFFNQTGTATVIDASPEFHPVATNQLDDGFMASPAVAGNALFLRTKTHLYRVEE
jgi:outer membrane protein assembly factor BamB